MANQDCMVSNLPLLFSNGNPTMLQMMSAEDLQYFLQFLLNCLLKCEPSSWLEHPKPIWWPVGVPWSVVILSKEHRTPLWQSKFQQLVKRCYEYNHSLILLNFSARLYTILGSFRYSDNWDGTTSIFDIKSGKLLVTFRNENRYYDKGFRQSSISTITSRPQLLPIKPTVGLSLKAPVSFVPTQSKKVNPLPEDDVFLCEECGAEFNTLTSIKVHERACMLDTALQSQSSNCDLETNPDKLKFMCYFSLSLCNQAASTVNVSPAEDLPQIKRKITLNDKRYSRIPFSSNLGQSLKLSKLCPETVESLLKRYENGCLTRSTDNPIKSSKTRNGPSPTRFLPPCVQERDDSEWTHSYCFNRTMKRRRVV